MKDFFYLKHFQPRYAFWLFFFFLLGFLFIVYKAEFITPELRRSFTLVYWVVVAAIIMISFVFAGLLRSIGIRRTELPGRRIINESVNADGSVPSSLSKKDLLKLYNSVKTEPDLLLKSFLIYGVAAGLICAMAMGMMGAAEDTILLATATFFVITLATSFFGILLSENISGPLLKECKKMIHQKGLEAELDQPGFFTIKNRIYYFVFLFFILMVVAVSGVGDVTPAFLVFSFLALVIIIITGRVLFSSIYLVFAEVKQFAAVLPTDSRPAYLTGSSYAEAFTLSDKLNKAAEKLRESRERKEKEKERVAAIINSFAGPVIFADRQNRLDLFNVAAEHILKVKKGDHGKKIPASDGIELDDLKGFIRAKYEIEEAGKEKRASEQEEEIIKVFTGSGEKVYKVKTSRVHDSGDNFVGTVKVFYDLTSEKAVDEAKSRFISIAAHQLRTPLSGIKWIIRMALDGDAGKFNREQSQLLHKAYENNQRIIRLIDDLLNVSRIEEGKFGYTMREENLGEVLKDISEDFDHRIKEKKLKFQVNIPRNLPRIHIDKGKMTLVFQNVIDNAIKYTPEEGIVEVSARKKGEYVEVVVKDSGMGIPAKEKRKIFSKFSRASNASRSEIGGSGLGLFIAGNIIDGHGGEIKLKSKEGEGTRIIIKLPLK